MVTGRVIQRSLLSNGFELSQAPDRLGWLVPTDAGRPLGEIWEQFNAQGYVWLKGILDRKMVLDFRAKFFTAYLESGLLLPGVDPREGVYSGKREESGFARQKLTEITRWADYEAFCLAEPIRAFYQAVLGGPSYLHKRKLIRYTLPDDPSCTGAHYDLVYLRAGTERVYTSWIPIGDIPVEMGGLVYLEGSHTWGRQKEAEFSALNAELPPAERSTHTGPGLDRVAVLRDQAHERRTRRARTRAGRPARHLQPSLDPILSGLQSAHAGRRCRSSGLVQAQQIVESSRARITGVLARRTKTTAGRGTLL